MVLIVLLGVSFGVDFLPYRGFALADGGRAIGVPVLIDAMCSWDGVWYRRIAANGYAPDPNTRSSVAFFPGYPMSGGLVSRLTGLTYQVSLLLVSNTFLLLAFGVLSLYVAERYHQPDDSPLCHMTLLAFGMFPTTVFFRMAYTESMFLFFVLLTLLALTRRWNPFVIALIAGFATGTRTVGVAVAAAFCVWIVRRVVEGKVKWTALASIPLSFWGITAFACYLYHTCGDPFAFVKAQSQWHLHRAPPVEWGLALVSLKPIWWVYLPGSPAYWMNHDWPHNELFALKFANPLYFLLACAALVYGVRRRYLSEAESVYSAIVLAIPYVCHSYPALMTGQARFASVAISTFLVLGQVLTRSAPWVAAYSISVSAVFLFVYAALFACWFHMY